jgi:hypothetical protein
MSTDRELLELAAKAAGHEIRESVRAPDVMVIRTHEYEWTPWNPLDDDGDALRLAVELDIAIFPPTITTGDFATASLSEDGDYTESWFQESVQSGDKPAATRRAIVRAAAEKGRSLAGQAQGQEGESRGE